MLGGTTGHFFHYEPELWLSRSTRHGNSWFRGYVLCTTTAFPTSWLRAAASAPAPAWLPGLPQWHPALNFLGLCRAGPVLPPPLPTPPPPPPAPPPPPPAPPPPPTPPSPPSYTTSAFCTTTTSSYTTSRLRAPQHPSSLAARLSYRSLSAVAVQDPLLLTSTASLPYLTSLIVKVSRRRHRTGLTNE